MARKRKTPEYMIEAVQRYNSKFDIFSLRMPHGTKEKIKDLGYVSANQFFREAADAYFKEKGVPEESMKVEET